MARSNFTNTPAKLVRLSCTKIRKQTPIKSRALFEVIRQFLALRRGSRQT